MIFFIITKGKEKYFDLFQKSFFLSMGLFYRIMFLFLVVSVISYIVFLKMPVLLSLFGISVPVYLYTKIFNPLLQDNAYQEKLINE